MLTQAQLVKENQRINRHDSHGGRWKTRRRNIVTQRDHKERGRLRPRVCRQSARTDANLHAPLLPSNFTTLTPPLFPRIKTRLFRELFPKLSLGVTDPARD